MSMPLLVIFTLAFLAFVAIEYATGSFVRFFV